MTTINHPITGEPHVLFPHQANWTTLPQWSRQWDTGLRAGIQGNEGRAALRQRALHALTFSVSARTLPERVRLDARVDEALKSGLAAVPFFGKGAWLAAPAAAGDTGLNLLDAVNAWPWAAGDYVILLGADPVFDCAPVGAVAGNALALGAPLQNAWVAGESARPLLFGKCSVARETLLSDWFCTVKLTVAERVNARSAQLGATPVPAPGVGEQIIGSTNVVG